MVLVKEMGKTYNQTKIFKTDFSGFTENYLRNYLISINCYQIA